MTTEKEQSTSFTAKLASFYFHNKISVFVLIIIFIVAVISLPGLGALVSFIISLSALFLCWKQGSRKLIGLNRPKSFLKTIFLGMLIGIIVQSLYSTILDPLFEIITGTKINLSGFDNVKGNLPSAFILLSMGWIIGGFLEEISFRGYLIPRIRYLFGENKFSTVIAVLASATPFGIAHLYQDWAGVLSTGTLGLIFAIIFVLNRYNVWLPIMVHGFANTVGILLIYLDINEAVRLF